MLHHLSCYKFPTIIALHMSCNVFWHGCVLHFLLSCLMLLHSDFPTWKKVSSIVRQTWCVIKCVCFAGVTCFICIYLCVRSFCGPSLCRPMFLFLCIGIKFLFLQRNQNLPYNSTPYCLWWVWWEYNSCNNSMNQNHDG